MSDEESPSSTTRSRNTSCSSSATKTSTTTNISRSRHGSALPTSTDDEGPWSRVADRVHRGHPDSRPRPICGTPTPHSWPSRPISQCSTCDSGAIGGDTLWLNSTPPTTSVADDAATRRPTLVGVHVATGSVTQRSCSTAKRSTSGLLISSRARSIRSCVCIRSRRKALYMCAITQGNHRHAPAESELLLRFLRSQLDDPNIQVRWHYEPYDSSCGTSAAPTIGRCPTTSRRGVWCGGAPSVPRHPPASADLTLRQTRWPRVATARRDAPHTVLVAAEMVDVAAPGDHAGHLAGGLVENRNALSARGIAATSMIGSTITCLGAVTGGRGYARRRR